MKTLACKDMGAEGCDFVSRGETAEEVVKAMTDHAAAAHPEKVAEMATTMTPEQMQAMMLAKVQDEA